MNEPERVVLRRELASTYWSRRTRWVKNVGYDVW